MGEKSRALEGRFGNERWKKKEERERRLAPSSSPPPVRCQRRKVRKSVEDRSSATQISISNSAFLALPSMNPFPSCVVFKLDGK